MRDGQRCFAVSGPTLWNTDTNSVLCTFKDCVILRAYETLAQHLCDSLGCNDCANTNSLTYLLLNLMEYKLKPNNMLIETVKIKLVTRVDSQHAFSTTHSDHFRLYNYTPCVHHYIGNYTVL